jgi:hypothetical protein
VLSAPPVLQSIEQHEGLYLNAEAGGGGSGAPAMATRQTSGGSSGVGGMKRQAAIEQVGGQQGAGLLSCPLCSWRTEGAWGGG